MTKGNVAINGTIDASPDFRAQKYNNCPKKAAHIPSKAMKTQLDKLTSVRGLISVSIKKEMILGFFTGNHKDSPITYADCPIGNSFQESGHEKEIYQIGYGILIIEHATGYVFQGLIK